MEIVKRISATLFIFIVTCFGKTYAQSLTLEMNATTPLTGSSLELSCKFSELFLSNGIDIRKGSQPVTTCIPAASPSYLCKFYKTGYNFTSNQTGVFGVIKNLSTEADGIWSCRYTDQTVGLDVNSNTLNITVYTIPPGLNFTQVPNMNVDLSVTSAQLQCTTSGCTYPTPLVQWLIQDPTASTPYEVYKTLNPTVIGSSCVLPEQLYTSTLDLQQNTTLSDNSDKVLIFSCRIEYPDSRMNLIASGSQTVRFAVRVTDAFLQYNYQNITSTLNVTYGEPVILTCVTGTSRPAPNIGWYIGSQSIGSGTSLNFTPSNTDHNEMIFCQAYNTNQNLKVDSNKPSLFVQVRVTEAFLQYDKQNVTSTLNVTAGKPVILTCVTGTSRPAPNIGWYIGSRSIGSGTSLNFTPSNTDHNEVIFCQAYNIDPNLKVDSNKPNLFVRVYVSKVTLEGLTGAVMVFHEGYPGTLKCISSPSRPRPIIKWFLNEKFMMDNITNSDIIDTKEMHVLTSEVTLILTRNSSNQKVSCEGFISGQGISVSTQANVDVRYAPDVKVNTSGSTVVGSTTVLMCTPQGNPPHYTFHPWIHVIGQTEIRRLDGVNTLTLPNISIQDMGTYSCTVDNSITGLDGQINQIGLADVYVQGPPVTGEKQSTFTGEANKSSSIQIPFYSNTSIRALKFIKHLDSLEISNTSDVSIYIQASNITMMFYRKKVIIPGHVAVLYFRNVKDTDFDTYTLQLSNAQGNVSVQFDLIASELPSPVIKDVPVGAVVGGIVGGIVVVIAIVSVAFVTKRRTLKPKMRELVDNPVYDASNLSSGTGIAVVTHAEDPSKLYAQVIKTKTDKEKDAAKGMHTKTSRAASKGKHGKTSRGNIYENATQAVKSSAENEYENPGQLTTGPSSGDDVYENPETSVSKGQLANKDGLLYADVILGPPTNKAGKPVILGMADHTVYAEIAYGKKGEPLLENDEEKKNGGSEKKNGTMSSTDE